MNQIKIVEYDHIYARSIAEMWNKSGDSWGGKGTIMTEKNIIEEHEGAAHLNVFLALDEDEVVGYCSFSEYAQDEGALYIPLLNVRTDYHGKGVGKQLVLTAVNKTIELGWSRLDLYTWPGNTKAVPLYKKCGFFWERRDDTTHLINLIPYVLGTEAVEDFFREVDWYECSKRKIDLKPDGEQENSFDFFEYSWEKSGNNLRMEFDRRSRGLRLIETDDYLIKVTVENLNLVFGKTYNVYYDIVNKSGKLLSIQIKGSDDKNIKYSLEEALEAVDTHRLVGEFLVDKIEEEQSEWRTHPAVKTQIIINGKKAEFKTGVVPKYPAKISMVVPNCKGILNNEQIMYIDIENNINEKSTFEFELCSNENIIFKNPKMNIEMKPLERKSVEAVYILKKYSFYKAKVDINVSLNSEIISFEKELSAILKGYNSMFGGETEDYWFIVNGSSICKLDKFDNEITLKAYTDDEYGAFIMYPKLGKPFSMEFSKIKPYKVESYKYDDIITMDAYYKSQDFKDIEFKAVSKLSANGILEHYYEVSNVSDEATKNEVWINDSIHNELYRAVMPYDGKYIDISNSFHGQLDFWDSNKLTENWLFSKGHKISRGLSWGKNSKIIFEGWFMQIENNLGIIEANAMKRTESLYWALGSFDDWKSFREFAIKCEVNRDIELTDHLDFIINNGNPFIDNDFEISIQENKLAYLNGNISFNAQCSEIAQSKNIKEEEKVTKLKFSCRAGEKHPIDTITFNVDLDDIAFEKAKTVFIKNNSNISKRVIKDHEMDVYIANNGILEIKAAPQFYNSLYSIIYNGNEWLDSSFPQPKPKSWFNPWAGGIELRPDKFMPASVYSEIRKAEFVELRDNIGNTWTGIKTSLKINENQTYKGLVINHYYLMLPGVPVLCYSTELEQNTGKYLDNVEYYNFSFIKAAEDITKTWVKLGNGNGETVKHKCGKVRQDIQTTTLLQFGSQERKDTISIATNSQENYQIVFANNQLTASLIVGKINCKAESSFFTRPTFFILGEKDISYSSLADLLNIHF